MEKIEKIEDKIIKNYEKLNFSEKWILSRLRYISDIVNDGMEKNNFSEVGIELQLFTKNEFCDYYIEEFKITNTISEYGNDVIVYVINNILRLWHPFIPFVTEELWNKIGFDGMLINADFSKVKIERNKNVEKNKEIIIEVIKEIRNIRANNNVMPNKHIKLFIKSQHGKIRLFNNEILGIISGMVKSESNQIVSKINDKDLIYAVTKSGIEIFVDVSNAKDINKEIEILKQQICDTKEYIGLLDKKLLNENFIKNAPPILIRIETKKKFQAKNKLDKLEKKLESLLQK